MAVPMLVLLARPARPPLTWISSWIEYVQCKILQNIALRKLRLGGRSLLPWIVLDTIVIWYLHFRGSVLYPYSLTILSIVYPDHYFEKAQCMCTLTIISCRVIAPAELAAGHAIKHLIPSRPSPENWSYVERNFSRSFQRSRRDKACSRTTPWVSQRGKFVAPHCTVVLTSYLHSVAASGLEWSANSFEK